jgi:tripartite ATP-independent transporter DctM subunit
MIKRNYDKPLACGSICAGGALGILIPPSVMIVLYGPTAGLSVGKLFAGAILPGFLLSFLYITYIALRCYFRPADGPPMPREERKTPVGVKTRLLLTSIVPPIFLIFAVLGTIFFGIASVTEAAAMGVIASIGLAGAYRRLNLAIFIEAVRRTLEITSMILMICVGAGFFSAVFVFLGGGDVVTNFVLGLPIGKWGTLFTMIVLLIVLGMYIDWLGIILIIVPLFTPIAKALGLDPIWFAMLVILTLQTSYLTPPFATAIFYLKGIAPPEVKTTDIYKGVFPFVGLQVAGILLCILFPKIITILPRLMIK